MSSGPLIETKYEIHAALREVARRAATLTSTTPTSIEHALDYLHAVIPFDHPARGPLLQLVDLRLHWTRYPDELDVELVHERIAAITAAIDAEPVDVPELADADALRALSGRLDTGWHNSDVTAALTGGRYLDEAGNGYLYPTVVLYQKGRPVAQINLARLIQIASDQAPTR